MPINLNLDDKLVDEARKLGEHGSKRDAVNAALAEYVLYRKQQKLIELFGTIDYDPRYNYKRARRKR